MHRYFIKTPWWVKKIFSSYVWSIPTTQREVFLTFDDGPHPTITPWVLKELAKYSAKATFFCIGENVVRYPDIYQQLIAEGHSVGNHTQRHLNGWKTETETYLGDVAQAARAIQSNLFRPPYGRIKPAQAKGISNALQQTNATVVMWDVLSADFDQTISAQRCTENVLRHVQPGSIIVFHDSEKAFNNLKESLPVVLAELKRRDYACSKLKMKGL